jgi:hypothetical protein
MIRSTEEFRAAVKAARRVGTPLLALRTADPASAITQGCASVNGKQSPPPLLVWDFVGGLQGRNEAGIAATVNPIVVRRRSNPKSELAISLPVFGCCARGTAKRLREMALVRETCLDRNKRNGFLAKQ